MRLVRASGDARSGRGRPALAVQLVEASVEQELAAPEQLLEADPARLDVGLVDVLLDRGPLADRRRSLGGQSRAGERQPQADADDREPFAL
jgi:hypothetical protein